MSTKRKLLISIVSVVSALAIAAGVTLGVLQPWQGGEVLDTEPAPSGQVEVVEETEVELTNGDTGIMTMSARQIPVEEYEYYSIGTEDTLEHFEITPVLTVSTSDGYGQTAASVSTDLIDIAYYTWTIDWMKYEGEENVNNEKGSYSYSQGGDSIKSATSYDGETMWYVADGWATEGVSNFIKFTTKEMYAEGGGFNEGESETADYTQPIDGTTNYTDSTSDPNSTLTSTDYTEGWTYDVATAYTVGNTLAIPSVLAEIDHAFGTPIGLTLTVVDYGGNEISASVRFDYMAKLTSDNFTVYSGVKGSTRLSEDGDKSNQVTLGADNGYQELFSAIYHEPWQDSLVEGDVGESGSKDGTAHDAYFEIASVNGIQLKVKENDDNGAPYWTDISNALGGYDQAVSSNSEEGTTSHPTTDVTYAYASYAVAAQEGASIFFEESDATWSTGTVYTSTKTWSDWEMKISYTNESNITSTHKTSMTIDTAGADDDAMATTTSWNGDDSITASIFASTNSSNSPSGITALGAPVQGLRYSDLRTFDRSQTKGVLSTTKQSSAEAMMTMEFYCGETKVFTFSFSFNDYEMIRVDASAIELGNGNEGVTAGKSDGTLGGVVAGG